MLGAAVLLLFALWTVAAEAIFSDQVAISAWAYQPFGRWPASFGRLAGRGDQAYSLFLSMQPDSGSAPEFTEGGGRATSEWTLGFTTIGSIPDSRDTDCMNAMRITSDARGGAVRAVSIYVPGAIDPPPNDQFSVAIYSNAHDAPATLIARSDSARLLQKGWNTVPLSARLQARTRYWIAYNTNALHPWTNNPAYDAFDPNPVDRLIRARHTPALTLLADGLSAAASPVGAGLVLALPAIGFWRRRRAWALAAVSAFGAGLLLELLLKTFLFYPVDGSYPSGHALRAALVCLLLASWLPQRAIRPLLLALVIAVGVSRVYLGAHYGYEAAGGILAGCGLALLVSAWQPDRVSLSAVGS